MSVTTVKQVCQYYTSLLDNNPIVVETGCTYVCNKGDEVDTSTNNLLEMVTTLGGVFYSFDIDAVHLAFAKNFVDRLGADTSRFIQVRGDSVQSLSKLVSATPDIKISMAMLDSKEFDEDHMVDEYKAICFNLSDKHIILIDDIHNTNSVKYRKAVPLMYELGYECCEISTPTGLLIAAKGYPLP